MTTDFRRHFRQWADDSVSTVSLPTDLDEDAAIPVSSSSVPAAAPPAAAPPAAAPPTAAPPTAAPPTAAPSSQKRRWRWPTLSSPTLPIVCLVAMGVLLGRILAGIHSVAGREAHLSRFFAVGIWSHVLIVVCFVVSVAQAGHTLGMVDAMYRQELAAFKWWVRAVLWGSGIATTAGLAFFLTDLPPDLLFAPLSGALIPVAWAARAHQPTRSTKTCGPIFWIGLAFSVAVSNLFVGWVVHLISAL